MIYPNELQWGRGLKTPEMPLMMAEKEIYPMLQWGRGLKTPEIYPRRRRKRRRCCFNGAGVLRPRKCSDQWGMRNISTPLQWGRGLKTPEIHWPPAAFAGKTELQWGRGLKTPEMTTTKNAAKRKQNASMGPGS